MKFILASLVVIKFVCGDPAHYANQLKPSPIFLNRNMGKINNIGAYADYLKIYYGKEVRENRYIPWQAAVIIKSYGYFPGNKTFVNLKPREGGVGYCGASLISNRHLITAAHCLLHYHRKNKTKFYFIAKKVNVKLGVRDRAIDKNGIVVSKFKWHPMWNYVKGSYYNDIAILWLPESYKKLLRGVNRRSIKPISLPNQYYNVSIGTRVRASGYGLTHDQGEKNTRLHWVGMRIIPCSEEHLGTGSSFICAIGGKVKDQTYGDTCAGDSGGPLYIYHEGPKKKNILVGVTSYGVKNCSKGSGVYTRITHFMPFILANIPAAELDIV